MVLSFVPKWWGTPDCWQRRGCSRQGELPLGTAGVYRPVPHQEISEELVSSPLLGEIKTVINFGFKSWFGDVSLTQVVPFGVCHLFFKQSV